MIKGKSVKAMGESMALDSREEYTIPTNCKGEI